MRNTFRVLFYIKRTAPRRNGDVPVMARITINGEDTDAMNLYARVKRGDVSQCSFGFDILQERTDVDPETGHVHWTIERVRLYEVSCCTFPAYQDTEITARAEEYRDIQARRAQAWREKMKARMNKWH